MLNLNTEIVDWQPDLNPPAGGSLNRIPLVEYLKGEIYLEHAYSGLTFGYGVTPSQRAINTSILARAMIDSGLKRRPLVGKKGAVLEIDYIDHTQNYTEFNLNGMTLRHGPNTATTMLYVHGLSPSSRIESFKLYNGFIDANAQAKNGNFYVFSALYHSNMHLEDLTFIDFWCTAWIISDPYPNYAGYVIPTSNDLVMRRIRNYRSSANIAHIASHPGMMQGDQAVVTGVSNPKLEDIYAYYSGRSGLSIGLNNGGYLRDFRSSLCWVPIYVETWINFEISDYNIQNHMHFDGAPYSSSQTSAGIWLTDGDQSLPGTGMASCANGIIKNGIITSMARPGPQGIFAGIRVSGRSGSYGAKNIQILNPVISGFGATSSQGMGVLFEGQLQNVVLRGALVYQGDCAFRASLPYAAPGSGSVNQMIDCWVDGMNTSACGYSAYVAGGGASHIRSGMRNCTGGGSGIGFGDGFQNHSSNSW